ncbi:hypothetical protein AAMO2058_000545300 [Amorphochlora amoebiformis]
METKAGGEPYECWAESCKALKIDQKEWWDTIKRRYGEKKRQYHTMNHIKEMFAYYRVGKNKLTRPHLVALAILFHDIIYNPKYPPGLNERKSAELWLEFAREARSKGSMLTLEDTQLVYNWILKTASHKCSPMDSYDCRVFMDWDMAILAQPWKRYEKYMAQVRQEFQHVPDFIWCTARGGFLRDTLREERIYNTKEYIGEMERTARENMARELKILDCRVGFVSKIAAIIIIFANGNPKSVAVIILGLAVLVALCILFPGYKEL